MAGVRSPQSLCFQRVNLPDMNFKFLLAIAKSLKTKGGLTRPLDLKPGDLNSLDQWHFDLPSGVRPSTALIINIGCPFVVQLCF